MPWGATAFNSRDKKITPAYKPTSGFGQVTYQVIQWANFTQTFSSAIASNTGPAVSSGGGTQAFQFAAQGKIAYADDLLDSLEEERHLRRLPPGPRRHDEDRQGLRRRPVQPRHARPVVQQVAPRSRPAPSVPTDWQSYMDACTALKKIGVYGYGTGAGAGNFTGATSWSAA